MAKAVYLEHYLDSLDGMPIELHKNFDLMRELDKKNQNLLKEIDSLVEDYLNSIKNLSSDDKTKRIKKIDDLFDKANDFSENKVTLAGQTYEMVDKHIRKLDSDLARFELDLKDKATQSPEIQEKAKRRKKKNDSDVEETSKKRSKKKSQPNIAMEKKSILPLLALTPHTSDVLDMPVDPNEPTYCLCHQVSYGEMIGCDNADCPIEWFHFQCVSLTTKPKGKWFCPRCTAEKKKK